MNSRFIVRWIHEKSTVTDSITMQPKNTTNEIWNELYRASRQSRSQTSLLQSERIEICFFLLQETSIEVKYRNLAFTKVTWANTKGFKAWYERNVGIGTALRIELHTQAMARPELLDGTVAPGERPNYWATYVRFADWDAMDRDRDGQGVRPPSLNWNDEGEHEDEDEGEDDEMFGPATLTFIGPRGKPVGSREDTKKKAGGEEEDGALERFNGGGERCENGGRRI